MKASHSWLQSYCETPLPEPEELAALLTEHVFEVEGIEQVGDDAVFDFKVLPDRAHHLLSHRGLAREIGVILDRPVRDAAPAPVEEGSAESVAIAIEAPDFCRRVISRRFENVVAETPATVKERLAAVGQKSINALVDASNYVMLDIGQPSHVLDADKVRGDLVIRNARKGETIEILGGKPVALLETDVVIADDEGPLEIAGVKGGERAAVTAGTRNVIVHAANYAPSPVRRTATRLNLRSDASKRFENEITPAFAEEGMARLSALIREMAPEAVAGPVTDLYPVARKVVPFLVRAADVAGMLGEPVTADEIADLLARMDCAVEADGDAIRVTPPSERFDLQIPEDVADEVGRIRGYNRLPGVLPPALAEAQPQDKLFWYGEKVKGVLAARGYSEVLLYAFGPRGATEVAYPLAGDKAFLRESLGEQLAERLAFNRRNADLLGLDVIRLCEVGQVFPASGERSAFALAVAHVKKGVSAEDTIREDLHALSEALGVEVPDRTDTVAGGAVCEVDFTALLEKLPAPGTLAELGLAHLPADARYAPIVPYPFVARDVAVFVAEGVAADEVQAVIDRSAGDLRVRTRLFDEFVKQQEGSAPRHSYAFRIVFQSPERTLADGEVNERMDAVHAALAAQGWEVR